MHRSIRLITAVILATCMLVTGVVIGMFTEVALRGAEDAVTSSQPQPTLNLSVDQVKQKILQLVNAQRQQQGIPPLVENGLLDRSTELKAQDMIAQHYWSHYGPDGTSPWHFFDEAGYKYALAGENLSEGNLTPEAIVDSWMQSPTHRANILGTGYTETGIAVVFGNYLNLPLNLLVVQHFGHPAPR